MTVATAQMTVLVNGTAGAKREGAAADQLRRTIGDVGLDADVVETESASDMQRQLRELISRGIDRVVVAGGDGTVAAAAQCLVHTNVALGILPQGTANNFATALRLPMDLPSALRVVKDGQIREVDLGRAGGRYFTESAGVGLFADILAVYGKGTNNSFFRGVYALARVFFSYKAHRIRLTVDDKMIAERAVMCVAANSFRMAEGLAVAPEARVTDGELDVVVIGDLKRSELIPYYRAFRAQTQESLPKVSTLRGREVRMESSRAMNVHCDDQVIGTTPVTITTNPRALKVLVDRL